MSSNEKISPYENKKENSLRSWSPRYLFASFVTRKKSLFCFLSLFFYPSLFALSCFLSLSFSVFSVSLPLSFSLSPEKLLAQTKPRTNTRTRDKMVSGHFVEPIGPGGAQHQVSCFEKTRLIEENFGKCLAW